MFIFQQICPSSKYYSYSHLLPRYRYHSRPPIPRRVTRLSVHLMSGSSMWSSNTGSHSQRYTFTLIVVILIYELRHRDHIGSFLSQKSPSLPPAQQAPTHPSMLQHAVDPLLGRIKDTPITPPFLVGTVLLSQGD